MRYRRDSRWFSAVSTMKFGDHVYEFTPCAYCGMPAEAEDHVVPRAFTFALSDLEHVLPYRLILVPSCHECNILSGDAVFPNVTEKRKYIHHKIRLRYHRILEIPRWEDHELEELSPALARYVRHGLSLRAIILSRLRWKSLPFGARNVGGNFLDDGRGSDSAPPAVAKPSTPTSCGPSSRLENRRKLRLCRYCGGKIPHEHRYAFFCSFTCAELYGEP